jgi:hypothetical protein
MSLNKILILAGLLGTAGFAWCLDAEDSQAARKEVQEDAKKAEEDAAKGPLTMREFVGQLQGLKQRYALPDEACDALGLPKPVTGPQLDSSVQGDGAPYKVLVVIDKDDPKPLAVVWTESSQGRVYFVSTPEGDFQAAMHVSPDKSVAKAADGESRYKKLRKRILTSPATRLDIDMQKKRTQVATPGAEEDSK